ncbi:MAG: hypothetical protein ABSB19_12050 [Methylomonas sp.]
MKKPSKIISGAKSDLSLEQQAQAHYSCGRYKEAADLYKALLKHGDNPLYRRQLAQCYLQRALNMAAKSMPKEAAVLWENYAEWDKPGLCAQDAYILWLLAANMHQKAYARLERLSARDLDENYPGLAARLGFLIVSGHAELAAHAPQDGAFMAHLGFIQAALDAFRNGLPATVDEQLKKLPYRSAFRDLRALLKAQLAGPEEMEQRGALLTKIDAQSPYRPAADALLAHAGQGANFVAAALKLDYRQRRILGGAKGLSARHCELLENLSKLGDRPNDKSLFNLALQYRALFGEAAAQKFCLGMLAKYPAGYKDYVKNFANVGVFEQNRIEALLCEQGRNDIDALFYWRQCINILNNENPRPDRKIAIILRHMAVGLPEKKAVGLLKESLDYDAGDLQTYVKLLRFYEQPQAEAKEYEHWLQLSLQRFPMDTGLLARAAQSASARKAYKKAANYAEALLKIDPVNTLAKQLLFDNHRAHARRLIKTKKFALAEKEIQAAEQLSVNTHLRRQAELLRGFMQWSGADTQNGLQLIVETLQKMYDDPVNSLFQAALEALLLDIPQRGN